mgnify:CR=1 FL=1
MKAAPFEYARPATLAEACSLLAAHGPDTKLITGGQSMVPMMAMRLSRPAWLIDISRLADHVVGEFDAVFPIVSRNPHLVVSRKPAAVAPAEHLRPQIFGEGVVCGQELKHRAPEALGEQRFGHRRYRDERAIGTEHPVGGEHMQVWVKVGQVPDGLHEQDQAGPGAGGGLGKKGFPLCDRYPRYRFPTTLTAMSWSFFGWMMWPSRPACFSVPP